MNVTLNTSTEVNVAAVERLMIKKASRAVVRAGAYVRKVARSSIKRSPEPSRPGEPPHTRKGVLKRSILYAAEEDRKSVYVGPSFMDMGVIGGLHEQGGRNISPKKPRVYKIGNIGPISEESGAQTVGDLPHVRLKTSDMVRKANELSEKYTKSNANAKYPPRPFIGPALEKSRDKIMEFFNDPQP